MPDTILGERALADPLPAPDPLAAYVAATVAQAPPLTVEQRDRIAALLRGGGK